MNHAIAIFLGGGLGSLLRYGLATAIYTRLGRDFPYGTLAVNVIGSFFIGLLTVLLLERFHDHLPYLRSFLLIGCLGGFTTFATFSIETLALVENGEFLMAFFNICLSFALCFIAVFLGAVLGRQV